MRRILFQETDFNALPNPPAGFKYIGFDGPDFSIKQENGQISESVGATGPKGATGATGPAGSGGTSSTVLDVTYSELIGFIDEGGLTTGKFYKITDFKTCYDQPDYDYNSEPIGDGNYKQGSVSPIIVFAISSDSLSSDAYQPEYPNDNIKYDASFSQTEVTGGTAYGRITERIDEFNNRTDYDHREVLFRRYDNYYYKETDISEGTIELIENTGEVIGTETVFSNYNTGDYIAIPNTNEIFFEIVSIESDTSMIVTGLSIPTVSAGANFYSAQRDGLTYKQNNISIEYSEHPTFLFEDETIISNYIGDVASFIGWEENTFLLPNNVFGEDVIGNRIGNGFRNNTFASDVEHNVIGDQFENNTIVNDDDFTDNQIATNFRNNLIICDDFNDNIIGDGFSDNKFFNNNDFVDNQIGVGFNNNTIYGDFEDNKIGNGFYENVVGNDFNNNSIGNGFNSNNTYQDFEDNLLGNYFYNNLIYSQFYKNEILNNFVDNVIGDSGNLDNFEFYENRIGNDFNNNTIRQDFKNNRIGNNFQENYLYGDYYKNLIENEFNDNHIGYGFYGNHVGNGFYDNYIGDYFYNNKIGEYFENNYISNNFNENSIGNEFNNNTLGDTQYFTWNNTSIENLADRNYETFYNALGGGENIGSLILGKELIMHFSRNSGTVITNGELIVGEAYEITNYQGTDDFTDVADIQSGVINTNGCVFIATGPTVSNWSSESELTELTSYDEYHTVKFTQWTQNNNGGGFSYERTKVYPTSESTVYFTKLNYDSEVDVIIPGRLEITRGNNGAIYNYVEEDGWDQNVSPQGTEWNSIYTQNQNEFTDNEIQNEFKGNLILGEFYYNKIGNEFASNILHDEFSGNITGGAFYSNDINSFYLNRVREQFWYNTIGDNFNNNEIDIWFEDNNIASDFSNNKIGKNFHNNTIEEGFGSGYGDTQINIIGDFFQNNNIGEYFYNNKVASYFQNNNVGYYFQRNNIDTTISEEDFTTNYGNILSFTYQSSGTTSTPGFYNSLSGTTNEHGESASFGITVSGGTISIVSLVSAGNQYGVGDTIVISGNSIEGQTGVIEGFTLIDNPTGLEDGTYTGLTVSGGSGSNALFDIEVFGGGIFAINLNDGGGDYIIGNTVSIIGSYFGGTNNVDDITINVDSIYSDDVTITVTAVSPIPSVYETYNCQIFERKGGNKRLSFYDENDILTIKNINE